MTAVTASRPVILRPQLAAISLVGSCLVTIGVFLSGFVIAEPAPYEVFMAGLIGLWALFGLRISRATAPLTVLLVLFMIGGILSLTVMADLGTGPMYMAVTGFLCLTAVFFAASSKRATSACRSSSTPGWRPRSSPPSSASSAISARTGCGELHAL